MSTPRLFLLVSAIVSVNFLVTDRAAIGQDVDKASPADVPIKKHGAGRKGPGGIGRQFQLVTQLTSLSDNQRKQINSIIETYQTEIEPLKEKIREMKHQTSQNKRKPADDLSEQTVSAKPSSAKQAAQTSSLKPDDDTTAQLQEMRNQWHERTQAAMHKVQAVLTPEQLEELKSLKEQQRQQRRHKSGFNKNS